MEKKAQSLLNGYFDTEMGIIDEDEPCTHDTSHLSFVFLADVRRLLSELLRRYRKRFL